MTAIQLIEILSKLPPESRVGIGQVGHNPEYVSTIGTVSVHKVKKVVALNCSRYGGTEHNKELTNKWDVLYEHPEHGRS